MGNAHHILQEPRDLIRSIPGVKYVELNESTGAAAEPEPSV